MTLPDVIKFARDYGVRICIDKNPTTGDVEVRLTHYSSKGTYTTSLQFTEELAESGNWNRDVDRSTELAFETMTRHVLEDWGR